MSEQLTSLEAYGLEQLQRLARIDRSLILASMRAELAYRLPQSGQPLRYIVLTREEVAELVEEIGKADRSDGQ